MYLLHVCSAVYCCSTCTYQNWCFVFWEYINIVTGNKANSSKCHLLFLIIPNSLWHIHILIVKKMDVVACSNSDIRFSSQSRSGSWFLTEPCKVIACGLKCVCTKLLTYEGDSSLQLIPASSNSKFPRRRVQTCYHNCTFIADKSKSGWDVFSD